MRKKVTDLDLLNLGPATGGFGVSGSEYPSGDPDPGF
jgi:hypothetical protein